jgi:hypothetical protein
VPSLAYRLLTWVLTVFGETDSSRAISGAVRFFQAYLQISESTYAKPRVVQPLIPVEPDS